MEVDEKVYNSLVEIFKAVADEADGAEDRISEVYEEEMENPHMKDFYGDLVDNNPYNWVL